jgi:hypothetical protein
VITCDPFVDKLFSMTLPDIDSDTPSGNKIVRTFRMPKDLVHALGKEAVHRGLDLTALVLRILHGYLTYFALPEAAIAQLEADRTALKMDRTQYLAHILYHRCLAVRELGLGFDDPRCPETMRQRPPMTAEAPVPAVSEQAKNQPPTRPLGAAGGGAHNAVEGLGPGAGVWPSYAIKGERSPKR